MGQRRSRRQLLRSGAAAIAAIAFFALMVVGFAALAGLVFLRSVHYDANGVGYWKDFLGYRAGDDGVGLGTVVDIFLDWHRHWQHNLAETLSFILGIIGLGIGKWLWDTSRGAAL